MSRLRRIPYIKDKPRNKKRTHLYWKRIRRVCKNIIKSKLPDDNLIFPNPKSIVNDYDYCDYWYLSQNIQDTRK